MRLRSRGGDSGHRMKDARTAAAAKKAAAAVFYHMIFVVQSSTLRVLVMKSS